MDLPAKYNVADPSKPVNFYGVTWAKVAADAWAWHRMHHVK